MHPYTTRVKSQTTYDIPHTRTIKSVDAYSQRKLLVLPTGLYLPMYLEQHMHTFPHQYRERERESPSSSAHVLSKEEKTEAERKKISLELCASIILCIGIVNENCVVMQKREHSVNIS